MKTSSPNSNKYIQLIEYLTSDIDEYPKLRGDIYQLSHLALGECKYHQDWVEHWDKVYQQVKKHL